jgi:hypothetical protein
MTDLWAEEGFGGGGFGDEGFGGDDDWDEGEESLETDLESELGEDDLEEDEAWADDDAAA